MTAVLLFWEEGIKETVYPSPPSPSLKILICGVRETVDMRIFKIRNERGCDFNAFINVEVYIAIQLRDKSSEISPLCSTGYCCT
jgi:hypothetical protein